MISTLSSSNALVTEKSNEATIRHAVSEAEATANNHDRIMRMARKHSRLARPMEMVLLRAAVKRTFDYIPNVETRDNLFCTVFPETLSRANLTEIDTDGYVMDKIEGVAANAWALYTSLYPPTSFVREPSTNRLRAVFPPQPAAYVGDDAGGDETTPGRWDTLMLVFRDGAVLCYDNCPLIPVAMRKSDGRTGLDGELCVRRNTLSPGEHARLRLVSRDDAPFGESYLDRDDNDPASDDQYSLCFLAHDIMLADNAKQTVSTYKRKQPAIALSSYSERLTKMVERLQPKSVAAERAVKPGAAAVANGERVPSEAPTTMTLAPKPMQDFEIFAQRVREEPQPYRMPLFVMAKQPFPIALIRHAFHTRMRRIVGIRTDGLIFIGKQQPFSPVFIDSDGSVINPAKNIDGGVTRLKKYKPRLANSFDAMLVRNAVTSHYELYASDRETPVPSAGLWYGFDDEEIERTMTLGHEVVEANTVVRDARLFRPEERVRGAAGAGRSIWDAVVCECNPYISPQAEVAIAAIPPPTSPADEQRYVLAVAAHIRWQPVLERTKKRRANNYANFCGIIKAIALFPTKEEICAYVRAAHEARRVELGGAVGDENGAVIPNLDDDGVGTGGPGAMFVD